MKSLYDHRDSGQKVTINSADGGSPHDVIKTAIKKTMLPTIKNTFLWIVMLL
jgi:hypothetical protein